MKYRIAQMQDKVNVLTTNPPAEDLDFVDVVSRLTLKVSVKNPSASGAAYLDHITSVLTDIEIVDGSDVLVSLSGKRLLGMNYWDKGHAPYQKALSVEDTSSRFLLDIDFGRYLWDTELGFDASKFKNPQLKLTFDDAKLVASGIQELNYDLYAYLFDEKVATPTGFLMRKTVEEWTPSQDAYHTVVMPTDYKYRHIFAYSRGTLQGISNGIEEIRLSENLDKKIPLDIYTKDLTYLLASKYEMFREYVEARITTAGTSIDLYSAITEDLRAIMSSNAAAGVEVDRDSDKLTLDASVAGDISGFAIGWNPMHMIPCLLCDQQDIEDWYDVTELDSLKLRTKAKNATQTSPEAGIYLEQLRTY